MSLADDFFLVNSGLRTKGAKRHLCRLMLHKVTVVLVLQAYEWSNQKHRFGP